MDFFEENRKSWNELTDLHVNSSFYDLAGFKKGNSSLNTIEINEIGCVENKKILHLQCHFGLDTLSFAKKGAQVTGIDISDNSISTAFNLSNELSIPGKFIRSNIYDIEELNLKKDFDIIYTSYGAINWLNDLDKWAKIIYRHLKHGGFFYMIEFHPFIYTLDDSLQINESYFKSSQIETTIEESYTDNSKVSKKNLKHIEWHHSLAEVLNSLISSGLQIEFINEFPFQVYNCFKHMVEIEDGKWVFEKYLDKIPYMFSIKATKP